MSEGQALTTREVFDTRIAAIVEAIGEHNLNDDLAARLNARFPAYGNDLGDLIIRGVEQGWLCGREAGGIRYGRPIKPGGVAGLFSVDVVLMQNIAGPHHIHTQGEIGFVVPLDDTARFDGFAAGWYVYPPGSDHHPTVSGGSAYILYLLPQGAIEFTGR